MLYSFDRGLTLFCTVLQFIFSLVVFLNHVVSYCVNMFCNDYILQDYAVLNSIKSCCHVLHTVASNYVV